MIAREPKKGDEYVYLVKYKNHAELQDEDGGILATGAWLNVRGRKEALTRLRKRANKMCDFYGVGLEVVDHGNSPR